jgi:hypothetical protein
MFAYLVSLAHIQENGCFHFVFPKKKTPQLHTSSIIATSRENRAACFVITFVAQSMAQSL